MEINSLKFKFNNFTRTRGTPVMLVVSCHACGHYLMHYQKDGPGPLKRCYLDRIHHPTVLQERQYLSFEKKSFPKLECGQCRRLIGFPVMYVKEKRPAYHLVSGAFILEKGSV